MKKSYFAIGAIAAAMCSCSSESIPSAGEGNVLPGTEDLAPISLSMTGNNTSVEVGSRTRGTGTVGAGTAGTGFATGTDWRNEELYILMTSSDVRCLKDYNVFKDNPDSILVGADIVTGGFTDETKWKGWGFTTLNGEGPWLREQFNGAIWARPQKVGDKWNLIYNSETNILNNDWYLGAGVNRFYPINGVSDFFAFYVDDACKYQFNQGEEGYVAAEDFDYTTKAVATGLDDPNYVLYKASADDSEYNYPQGPLDAHYPLITKDTVNRQMSIKFRIDGTQDLLAGRAKRQAGYGDGFSAKSARRGITPDITMNHLLTRLTFDIYRGDSVAKNIQITGIKIKSKDSGKLIVAYDVDRNTALGSDSLSVDSLIRWMDYNKKYADEVGFDEDSLRTTYFTLKQAKVGGIDPVAIGDKKDYLEKLDSFSVSSITHWVGEKIDAQGTKADLEDCHKPIGEAMFVAPGDSVYTMILEYKVLVDDRKNNGTNPPSFDNPNDPAQPGDDLLEKMKVTFDLKAPKNPIDNDLFVRGKSYSIKITVYGLRPILATAILEAWKDGGDVWVGGDNDDDDKEGLPDGVKVEGGRLVYE